MAALAAPDVDGSSGATLSPGSRYGLKPGSSSCSEADSDHQATNIQFTGLSYDFSQALVDIDFSRADGDKSSCTVFEGKIGGSYSPSATITFKPGTLDAFFFLSAAEQTEVGPARAPPLRTQGTTGGAAAQIKTASAGHGESWNGRGSPVTCGGRDAGGHESQARAAMMLRWRPPPCGQYQRAAVWAMMRARHRMPVKFYSLLPASARRDGLSPCRKGNLCGR